jgi:endonuclease I
MKTIKKLLIFTLFLLVIGTFSACGEITTGSTTTNPITATTETTITTNTQSTTITETSTEISTTETQTTDATTTVHFTGIEVVEVRKTVYEYNEAFDEDSLTVVIRRSNGQFLTLNKSMYDVTGFDSKTPGQNIVTVTHGEFSDSFVVTINEYAGLDITMEYYMSAQGLTGIDLLLELRSILIDTASLLTYGEARYILDETDADPDVPGNVILVYSAYSVSGVWDGGITWNREHVWPQSLLGVSVTNSTIGAGSDLQNLKPANPSFNSSRGNKYFDNVTTSSSYEPRDEVKGDIARILFYMVVMYDYLSLVDQNPNTYQMALLSVLLQWHILDPVDDFERNRNEVIYSYQGNRNPFIDYPEFVELIWS